MTPPSPGPSRSPHSDGFVLPTVLLLVGILSLIFLVAITALDTLGAQARDESVGVRFQQAALSSEAQAVFLAATYRVESSRLLIAPAQGPDPAITLALDGRRYALAAPRTQLSLQDEAGLVNLAFMDQGSYARLVRALGVPEAQRSVMIDRIADYVDIDSLQRTNGAEAGAYRNAGLSPPLDGFPTRPVQLLGILGWKGMVGETTWSALAPALTADPTSVAININTAPAKALTVMFGLTDRQAATAVAARQTQPFLSLGDFGRYAGAALIDDVERVYTFPNGRFVITVTDPATRRSARSRLVLTPDDPELPFWVEARTLSTLPPEDRPDPNAPRLPAPTS